MFMCTRMLSGFPIIYSKQLLQLKPQHYFAHLKNVNLPITSLIKYSQPSTV